MFRFVTYKCGGAARLDFEEGLPEVRGYAVSHLDAIAELLHEVIQDASHAI